MQVATQTPGEPLGLMAYGKRLLQDRKDIGDAFARAYIRTVNTYYQGDYHKDAKVMAEIQKFTGQTDAVFQPLAALDSLTMDWEMRKDTTTRVQQLFIDLGVITDFKTPGARGEARRPQLLRAGRRSNRQVVTRECAIAARQSAGRFAFCDD